MADEFDPYHVWLGIPPEQQPPTHYRLLGIEQFESNPDVIDAAASRQTAYLHQLASGPNRKASQTILNEVAAARRCLLNAQNKAAYDKTLQAREAAKADAAQKPSAKPDTSSSAVIEVNPAASPESVAAGGSAKTKIIRCGQCQVRIRATQATLERGLKCPKCGAQLKIRKSVAAGSSPPVIKIDTSAESPTRAIKEKKPRPIWAHPACIIGAGTALLLLIAGIAQWAMTPDTPETPEENIGQKQPNDPIDQEPVPQPVPVEDKEPVKPVEPEVFVVDYRKAIKKGKWTEQEAAPGFVGSGFVTSGDQKASIRFTFTPEEAGVYEARLRYQTSQKAYGDKVPVKTGLNKTPTEIRLNMKQAPLGYEGYRFLGISDLKAKQTVFVEMKVAGAGGQVYAESVEFIRRDRTELGLTGYWSLNQIAAIQLADIGGVSATFKGGGRTKGIVGQAVRLEGDHSVRLPGTTLSVSQGALSFWLRQDSKEPVVFVSTAAEESKDATIRIRTMPSEKELALAVQLSPSMQSPAIPIRQKIVPGQWYHLALTWKEGEASQVFCNGKKVGQRTRTPKLAKTPIRFVPGASKKPGQSVLLDEIRVYRRVLTEADVTKLYAQKNK